MFSLWIKQVCNHLAVVNTDRSDCVSANEAVVDIDTDAFLVAVVADAILFYPASIQVSLSQAICIFIPALGQPTGFDFRVLVSRIPLLGNWDKSCVNDLSTAG